MQLKSLFKVSAVACALALVGCGGDIEITPTVNDNSTTTDNSVNNSNNTDNGGQQDVVECASYESDAGTVEGTFDGKDCLYNDSFASKNISITANITFDELPDGGVHVFEDALLIGKDGRTSEGFVVPTNGPTMTVKPGATLAFKSGEAIVRIARGAKIQAVGTAEKPITFTSAFAYDRHDLEGKGPEFSDWGGILINGNGITNHCTNAQRAADTCSQEFEGVTTFFGGNDNTDGSGNIKFAKIWYAGSGPKVGGEPGEDLNSLTLNAVGSGSSFDYIHIHQGYDDGIEFFGGAANIKHIVVTDTQDDAIDIDAGWQGNAQFLYIEHGTVTTRNGATAFMGNNGFETDGEQNGGADYSEAPASFPTIANVTVVTTDGSSVRDEKLSQAIKFDDAIKSNYYNALFVKRENPNGSECIEFTTDGLKNSAEIMFNNSVMACASEFKDATQMPAGKTVEAWYENDGSNIRVAADADVLSESGFATNTSSTAITIDANDLSGLDSSFFDTVNYIGAVSDQDTSSVWYKWVETAVAAAKAD
ncbi:hypothetical protein Q4489_10835 [Thalassotalea sp. 1_MG-2023]|uniref:hypothetical protein n=1 Tax=Thalassotalea sp. 1_MG-2023 TaxID=3062680 RepID=UPI0026E39DAF|nr:hypothetical protein [Thalassotalea sp. 1_MG-2023]MDO6427514.1 hypothetical protein [Thalassotalea sp. 1_MG-2023]